jgi:hypothetical protein
MNPEFRATITVRNRHDPDRVSPDDVSDVVRKSVQIYSRYPFGLNLANSGLRKILFTASAISLRNRHPNPGS